MLMLFGSALSVSAEETTTETEETTNVVKPIQYVKLKNDSYVDYNDESLSIWWSIRIDELLDEPMYICLIKNENYSSEYESVYDDFIYSYESESFSDAGNLFHGTTYQYCKTPDVDWYLNSTNIKTNLYNGIYEKEYDSGTVTYRVTEWNTNVPMFDSQEDAEKYYKTGDPSWMLNDYYDNMETDETFGLTGFTADNTITASWTGTTHDDVIDTYAQAKVGIRPGYAYKSAPGQIAVRCSVLEEYEISDKTFTKLYDDLTHKDDSLFLRYLEVIPNYQKESLGAMYVGKSCFVWLNADGSVEKIENELHDGEHGGGGSSRKRDYDFELLDVYCGTMPFNSDKRLVSWEESSKDDLIRNLGYENTYVSIFCEGVSSDGTTQKFDCTDSMMTITGKSPIRVHSSSYLMGDDFTVAITDLSSFIIENDSLYDFDGIIYIIPHYIRADVDYVGNTTMINLYTNDVSIVDDEDSDDEEDESGDDDEEEDDDSGSNPIDTPDIGDITDITDIFPYFLNLIKILINSIGVVPKFFSTIFPFLPLEIRYILSIGLVLALILRLIGR